MIVFKKQSKLPKRVDSSTKKSEKQEVSINRNHQQDTSNGLKLFQNSIKNNIWGKNKTLYLLSLWWIFLTLFLESPRENGNSESLAKKPYKSGNLDNVHFQIYEKEEL